MKGISSQRDNIGILYPLIEIETFDMVKTIAFRRNLALLLVKYANGPEHKQDELLGDLTGIWYSMDAIERATADAISSNAAKSKEAKLELYARAFPSMFSSRHSHQKIISLRSSNKPIRQAMNDSNNFDVIASFTAKLNKQSSGFRNPSSALTLPVTSNWSIYA